MKIKSPPKQIKPHDKECCEIVQVFKAVPEEAYCNLIYTLDNTAEHKVTLKIPASALMFAKPLEGGIEKFKVLLSQLEDKSTGEGFELNKEKANSAEKMREVLASIGTFKVYSVDDNKGRVRAAIQYDTEVGLVQIDVASTNPIQCFMMVYCANERLRAAMAKTIIDLFASDN